LTQLNKVAVLLVVNFNDTPWVTTAADFASIGSGDLGVSTDDSERHLGHDLLVLGNGLFVIKLVAGSFEYLDGVVLNVGKDLSNVSA
jgi:hypothetical protein